MSVESISLVLNHSMASGTAKLVLVGIANHDGDGGSWPSIGTLARYANCSERSVQRAIELLVKIGEVVVHLNAGGTHATQNRYRPNRYEITVTPVDNPDQGVTHVSPLTDRGVTSMATRGDTGDDQGVTPASPEPSYNHPEPTAAAARSRMPVENLSDETQLLRAEFGRYERLSLVSFANLTEQQDQQIVRLVRLAGVTRLTEAARATHMRAAFAQAFLDTWAGLPAYERTTPSDEPVCGLCFRNRRACEASVAKSLDDDHQFEEAS